MLETEGFLRGAAANYQQAESHLEDAEHELRKLLEKLESCLLVMKNASEGEAVLCEQVKGVFPDDRPVAVDGAEMIGS